MHVAVPLIEWDAVRYSVPPECLGQMVGVRVEVDSGLLEITWGGRTVATHRLVDSPHDDVWDPAHRQAAEAAALGRTSAPLHLVAGPPSPVRPHRSPTTTWTPPTSAPATERSGRWHDTTPPYEQLKDDLGYLQLGRATECFATVAERAKAEESWSHVEYLAAVMAEQVAATTNRRLSARLRYARFPYVRSLERVRLRLPADRSTGSWSTTWPRCASSRRTAPWCSSASPGAARPTWPWPSPSEAVEAGYRGYFSTADAMVRVLLQARREGNFATKLRGFTAPSVLVVDDVGLLPIDTEGAGVFFHVVNARYENGHPTLVTTNRGLPAWGDVFGDPVVAGAILDRLMHRAVVFNIKGPSWRMREHSALAEASKA